nr:TetR family transcriptional regulator [Streptomyces sp. SID5785]
MLLDSAAAEFSLHGFTGTNLSDIATRSRLTKGALYGHFSSKAELADELTRTFEEEWGKLLAEERSSVRALALRLTRRMDEDVRFAAGLRLTTDAARVDGRESVPLGELRSQLVELIRAAQDDGRITEHFRPHTLAGVALALFLGTHAADWVVGDTGAADHWDAFLSALRTDAG